MNSSPYKIILIGSGQLGSRYLQGLVTIKFSLDIYVIDPSKSSLHIAKTRWMEIVLKSSPQNIIFSQDLTVIPKQVDLCIVTTTADVRLCVIEQVISICQVRYWVLEKVLAQSVEQIDRLTVLLSNAQGTWINTSRRLFSWHQKIAKYLPKGKVWEIVGKGRSWGMACNSIHFIDLISWWIDEKLVFIDNKSLERWFPSKRKGFWEVNGSLNLVYSRGSVLTLISNHKLELPFSMSLKSQGREWNLIESEGTFITKGEPPILGSIEFQSEITEPLVKKILLNGKCCLPTLKDSSNMHRILIKALLNHWNEFQQVNDKILPIT